MRFSQGGNGEERWRYDNVQICPHSAKIIGTFPFSARGPNIALSGDSCRKRQFRRFPGSLSLPPH
jgi:hypothetical protein